MKWFSWMIKMCMSALLLTTVCLYATWTAVQMMVGKVLDQYHISMGIQKIEFSDFLAELGKGLNIMKQPASLDSSKSAGKGGSASVGGSGTDGRTEASAGGKTAEGTGQTNPQSGLGPSGRDAKGDLGGASGGSDALPVWSQTNAGSSQARDSESQAEKKTVLSTDALQATKDKISGEDKMKLFTLLVSKLSSEELQSISKMMEDGITQQELSEMETTVRKKLTKEEFDQITAILGKYH